MTTPAHLMLCAAREIYLKRDELTPSAIRNDTGLTWKAWWSARFGRDYDEYVREMQERKNGGASVED